MLNLNSRIPDDPDTNPKPKPVTPAQREKMRAEHWSWLRFIFLAACDGMALGALVAVLAIRFNMNGIGDLLASSDHQAGYTLMLVAGFAHTFGMVVSGCAIWWRATSEQD